tara:strand:- start:67 stop:963 length:897 start_codon:yes stop_codon:yes gene_type:complete
MPFYPKSQYQSGFSTNGNEYSTLSPLGDSYKGPYYKTSNGKIISGVSPTDTTPGLQQRLYPISQNLEKSNPLNSMELIEGINDPKLIVTIPKRGYTNLSTSISSRNVPLKFFSTPTQKDYKLGVFTRYFCKKNNELRYFEIDKKTYSLLNSKNSSIAFDLYSAVELMWYLKGEMNQVFTLNKRLSGLIEKKEKWSGFSQYFKDKFTQFYLEPDTQENLYTSGKELKTPDGKEYIGPYHVHPEKGPMVGATHIKKKHDLLTPIIPITTPTLILPQTPSPQPPTSPSTGGGGGYSGGGGY